MTYMHQTRRAALFVLTAFLLALAPACSHVGHAPPTVVKPQVKHYEPYKPDDAGIRWMEWGDEAFTKARSSDKLVFLDVSATWCHWCMVMEETAYSDPRVVELVNSEFVPIYVDTDKRPDINDRYNQGGWPSIAVLTPDGRVIAGRTTLSADELLILLNMVNQSYKEDRDTVYNKLKAKERSLEESKELLEKDKTPKPLSVEMPYRVLRSMNLFVDPDYGGYGGPQKFPMPEVMQFALYLYPKAKGFKEDSPQKTITLTLDGMAGGIFDEVEGGFFRYSTGIDWKSPHYEKLLSTNGDLLGLYMRAYQLMDDNRYLEVGETTAAYMQGVLFDDSIGAFYASQAADERYFKLDFEARAAMGAPPVDGTVLADANGRAALGFLDAYRATGDERNMAVALRVVEYIIARRYKEGEGVTHSDTPVDGLLLSDQVYSGLAALRAYQATGNRRYLEFAMDVAGVMVKRFWDEDEGGFFDSYYSGQPTGLLAKPNKPQIENSKAAIMLMELYHITGEGVYKDTAKRALSPFTADYVKHSFWAAPFAHAVERCLEPTFEFIVIGRIADEGVLELIAKAYTYDDPDRVVVVLDPDKDTGRIAKLGYRYSGTPVLYVCSERACFPPVKPGETLDKVREYIEKSRAQ